MRTLKKTLCLVLVLAMMLGLGVVSVSADAPEYSDSDAITYKEAVDVLSTIGVLKGDEGGFRPTDELTRAEGCAIIVRLLGMDGVKGTAPFTDTVGHWAESEIAYCAREGIVNGIGDNLFDPDGKLTGSMFAKMLLGCLGYDAEIEGMTGPQWQITVAKLIREADLDHGIDNFDQPSNITREEAAQLGLNTLIAPMVEYDNKGSTVAVNGAEITFGASTAKYVVSKKNAQTISNDRLSDDGGGNNRPIVEYAEDKWPDLVIVGQGYSMNGLGRPVRQWTYKGAEIGTYVGQDMLVATYTKKVTAKDLYDLLGKGRYDSLRSAENSAGNQENCYVLFAKVNGVTPTADEELDLYADARINGVGGDNTKRARSDALALIDEYVNRTNTTKVNGTDNGSVTEVYINEDNLQIFLVTYDTWVFKASGDYKASSDSINITPAGDTDIVLDSNRLDGIDFPQIKDYKDGDYLLITATRDNANARYEVETVDKAELVTGTVSEFSYNSSYNVTIDGTKYSYSKNCKDADDDDVKKTTYTIGQKATVVLDKYGYIIDVDEASGVDNYVFVEDWGSSSNLSADARAKVYFSDGTDGEITVKSAYDYDTTQKLVDVKSTIAGWGSKNGTVMPSNVAWYKYSRNSNGEYTLNKIDSTYTNASASFTGKAEITNNNKVNFFKAGALNALTGYYINDNTIIIVNDKEKGTITTYTGVKNAPEITLNNTKATADAYVSYKNTTKYCNVIYISLTGDVDVSGSDGEKMLYVTEYNAAIKGSDNEDYHVYKVLKEDGSTESVQADTNIAGYTGKYFGAAYYVSRNNKDQLTKFREVGGKNTGTIFGALNQASRIVYTDGAIDIAGQHFTVDKNAKIYLVTMGSTTVYRDYGDTTIKTDARVLNNDKAATFESLIGNGPEGARALAAALNGYNYEYDVAAKKTTKDGSVIEELYVTVLKAKAAVVISSTSSSLANELANLGTGYTLQVSGDLAFDGTDVPVLTANDNLSIDGKATYEKGTININGTLSTKDLDVKDGTVNIKKGAKVTVSNLNLVKNTSDTTTVNVDGELVINGDLYVNNGTEVHLTANGKITVAGDVYIDGHVDTAAKSSLEVGGTVTITSSITLVVEGDATIGDLNVADGGKLVTKGDAVITTDSLTVAKGGTVAINGGSVETEVVSNESSDFVVNGGVLDAETIVNGLDDDGNEVAGAKITVKSGSIMADSIVNATDKGIDVQGGTVTTDELTNVESGSTTGTINVLEPNTMTLAVATGLGEAVSGDIDASKTADSVYTLKDDAATIEVTITNNGSAAVEVELSVPTSVAASSYKVTLDAGASETFKLTPKDGEKFTSSFAVTVSSKAVSSGSVVS